MALLYNGAGLTEGLYCCCSCPYLPADDHRRDDPVSDSPIGSHCAHPQMPNQRHDGKVSPHEIMAC